MPPRSPMGGVKTHVEDNHTHDVRYVLRNLWKYLYRYRFGMFAVLALSLLSNVLALLGPRLSGAAIDAITGGEHVNFPSVYRYALLMLAFYAVSAGLSFLISVYMVRLSQKIVSAMRCDAFQSISRLASPTATPSATFSPSSPTTSTRCPPRWRTTWCRFCPPW